MAISLLGSHLGPLLFLIFINDLPTVIESSKILLFADDVKLFYSFSNDCAPLQNDLNNLVKWYKTNLMSFNLNKCKQMSFFRTSSPATTYHIDNFALESVDYFCDLGVHMDHKLNFNYHIEKIVNKASRTLGVIKRYAKEFRDPYATKLLFTSVVRPILEYASVVWCPRYQCHIDFLESVQKQFLLFCLRHLGWDPNIPLPAYRSRLRLIRLPTLESRRKMLNVFFIFNFINGKVSCECLLQRINFGVPARPTRNTTNSNCSLLRLNYFVYNYLNFEPLRAAQVDFNNLYIHINFNMSSDSLKRSILAALN